MRRSRRIVDVGILIAGAEEKWAPLASPALAGLLERGFHIGASRPRPRAGHDIRQARGISNGIGDPRFGHEAIAVKNLERKTARIWRHAVDARDLAGRGGDTRTARAVDIVELVVVERKAKNLRPWIELLLGAIQAILVDEKVATEEIARLVAIRTSANAQVRMLDVDAIVENGDCDPLPARMPPGLAGVHDVELPLLGMGTGGAHALEFGNEMGEGERDLLGFGQSVRKLDHAFGDIAPAGIENGHLIADEGVARAHLQLEVGEHRPAFGLRR